MACWNKVAIISKKEKVKYSMHINEQKQGTFKKMSQCILGVIKTASNEQLVMVGCGSEQPSGQGHWEREN